ncbi:MAG TPA: hypothetical protein VLC98_05740 [Phnomibacter sp.]|nr:hypothetical protein [Phnomibacter sp.]
MKRILSFLIVALFSLCISNTASAKKFKVDVYVNDVNGIKHHVHGWIDVSFIPPQINSYDMWFDGIHMIGASIPNPELTQSLIPDYPDWSTEMTWEELVNYLNDFSPYVLIYGDTPPSETNLKNNLVQISYFTKNEQ